MSTDVVASKEPVYVDQSRRSEAVVLEWPFELDGRLWDRIIVRRVMAGEVEAFVAALQEAREKGQPVDDIRIPVFEAPAEVLKVIDQDDADRLNEVAQRFLPRRFQDRRAEPSLPTGEESSPA